MEVEDPPRVLRRHHQAVAQPPHLHRPSLHRDLGREPVGRLVDQEDAVGPTLRRRDPGEALEVEFVERQPLTPSLDGNTVDVSMEQAEFAKNAIRYQASLNFINSQMRGLMTAITGQ